jgi:hypothetical protein
MKFKSAIIFLLIFPVFASAHHSRAEYDGEIQITGKLVDILWRNPHPGFTIEVEEGGKITTWLVEGWSSLYTFDRADITQDRFQLGDTLSIAGLESTRRSGRILGTHILLADGTEAILRREAEPYWSSQANLGGHVNWETETRAAVVNATDEDRGIFRVWSYPSPSKLTKEYLPLTESARVAQAEFDQVDNFIMRCVTKGMPGSMGTPNPYEFIDEKDTIRIRGYEGDVVRTVHMNNSTDPATQPVSPQGYSSGQWEDKNTLVIHTTRINFPYLGMSGIPLSEAVEVVERYTLSEDQARLDFKFTFTDPTAFTEPAYYEYYWLALGETFGQYDCDVH